jgi:hypothetical protein
LELNRRVQGTETFWNDADGSEAILQVKAASASVAMSGYRASAVPTGLPAHSSTQTAQTRVRKKSKADVHPVAGVCGPGDPTTAGLTEAGYNAGPVAAGLKNPRVTRRRAFLNHAPRGLEFRSECATGHPAAEPDTSDHERQIFEQIRRLTGAANVDSCKH